LAPNIISKYWHEVTRSNPCPICGKTDWCSVSADGVWVVCRRLDNGRGIHRVDKSGVDYWLYRVDGSTGPVSLNALPDVSLKEPERAPDDILCKVYTSLLRALTLSDVHRENLRQRGLTDDEIHKRRYRTLPLQGRAAIAKKLASVYDPELLVKVPGFFVEKEGNKRWLTLAGTPGILIPVRNLSGQIVAIKIRADDPGEGPKYTWLSSASHGGPGPGNRVHIPTFTGDRSLVRITEGELKADIATALSDILTLSIPGVSSWRQALPVLKQCQAKIVSLAFDADAKTNHNVARALDLTFQALTQQGYEVQIETWDITQGKGIDDLLAAGEKPKILSGSAAAAAVGEIVKAAQSKSNIGQNGEANSPSKERTWRVGFPRYLVEDGIICRVRWDRHGEEIHEPLSNFEAKIVSEEVRDNGVERVPYFTIEGQLGNGTPLPPILIPASEYAGMSWITAQWGVRALVLPGYTNKDHLRAAIQILSGDVPRKTVYTHTGWRKVEGKWIYLTGTGGIGSEGFVPAVDVQLETELRDYCLPEPPEEDRLRAAVQSSLRILDLAPERISAPLLGAVYLAPLGEATKLDLSLFLVGRTGGFKTATAAVIQAHWGSNWDDRNLPGGWASTANALEKMAFLAKDAVFVVDDFVPKGTASEVRRLHREADRLLRAQGNRYGRNRMKSNRALAGQYCPRGIVIGTGEDIPRGESLSARVCIIEVRAPDGGNPGDINVTQLTEAQKQAAEGRFAEAMAGYVKWLAPQMDELKQTLPEVRRQLRQQAYREGQHRRIPDMVAALYLGWVKMLEFAGAVGAITAEECEKIGRRVWRGLGEMAEAQAEHLASEDVANRFLSLLSAAITSGRAHIANAKDGREPPQPQHWGWREVPTGGEFLEWRPQGELIGWLDGVNVYLEPEVAYAVAQKLARDQNTSLPVAARTLWKRLREKGVLSATESKKNTVKRQIADEPKKRRVLSIHYMSLLSTKKGDLGDLGDLPSIEAEKRSPFFWP